MLRQIILSIKTVSIYLSKHKFSPVIKYLPKCNDLPNLVMAELNKFSNYFLKLPKPLVYINDKIVLQMAKFC
jgi:hypothetical protein